MKPTIIYEGEHSGYYVFRICLGMHKTIAAYGIVESMTEWLNDNAHSKFHIGNDFETMTNHRNVIFRNPKFADHFVLLETLVDVAIFEHQFEVLGVTPTMLL